eukprot:gene10771-7499_t
MSATSGEAKREGVLNQTLSGVMGRTPTLSHASGMMDAARMRFNHAIRVLASQDLSDGGGPLAKLHSTDTFHRLELLAGPGGWRCGVATDRAPFLAPLPARNAPTHEGVASLAYAEPALNKSGHIEDFAFGSPHRMSAGSPVQDSGLSWVAPPVGEGVAERRTSGSLLPSSSLRGLPSWLDSLEETDMSSESGLFTRNGADLRPKRYGAQRDAASPPASSSVGVSTAQHFARCGLEIQLYLHYEHFFWPQREGKDAGRHMTLAFQTKVALLIVWSDCHEKEREREKRSTKATEDNSFPRRIEMTPFPFLWSKGVSRTVQMG